MGKIAPVLALAVAAVFAPACDGSSEETQATPTSTLEPSVVEASPTPEPTATGILTPVIAPTGTPMISIDMRSYHFRSFTAALNEAIDAGDVEFFVNNARFQDVSCGSEGIAAPSTSCTGQPASTTVESILECDLESDCSYLDAEAYEETVRAFLTDVDWSVWDTYGYAKPRLHAFAVFRSEFQPASANAETAQVQAIVTSIAPSPGEHPSEREVLLFGAGSDSMRWGITQLTTGSVAFLEPGGPEGIFEFWESWAGSAPPLPVDPDEIWATYRNDEYGFEFEYPESCELREGEGLVFVGRIGLAIEDSEGLALSEYVNKSMDELVKEGYTIGFTQTGTVGGEESIVVSYRIRGSNRMAEDTFFQHDGSVYTVGWYAVSGSGLCGYEPETYARMLSTFRFIE
jgi:hypothetical protein